MWFVGTDQFRHKEETKISYLQFPVKKSLLDFSFSTLNEPENVGYGPVTADIATI